MRKPLEQGYSMDRLPREGDTVPQTVLPIRVQEAIHDAQAGDAKAWGVLYAAAAAYTGAGAPIPEPLGAMITQRLAALGKALIKPPKDDTRAGVLDAAAPHPKAVRLVGAKKKSMTVQMVAEDALRYVQAGMSLRAASRKVASLLPIDPQKGRALYTAESIAVAAKQVRKQQKNGGE